MNYSQLKQNTQLEHQSPVTDLQVIDGVLYFTVDLGRRGKQRWKNDGIRSAFIASL